MSKKFLGICSILFGISFSVYSMDTVIEMPSTPKNRNNKSAVPTLNLPKKTALKTVEDVEGHLSARVLALRNEQSVVTPNSVRNRQIDIGVDSDTTRDILGMANLSDRGEKLYSEEDMMTLVKLSPALYELGQRENKTARELLLYAKLLNEFKKMKPRAMAGYIKKNSALEDKTVKDWEVDYYAQLQKGNSEAYIAGMLGIITDLCDKHEGKVQVSVLNDTHVEMLEAHISTQKSWLKGGVVVVVLKLILLAGTVAWAVYGQVPKGAGNNSTVF